MIKSGRALMVNKALRPLSSLQFPLWSFPILLLAVSVAGFGLLVPWLGFYQDDWHAVFYAHAYGPAGLWELYFYDNRPLSAWPYVLAFPILGFKPLPWHLSLLALRWLTATTLWAVLRSLWPRRPTAASGAALLFAVYPLFKLQPLAVAYTQHWASFFLYTLSLLAMLQSLRRPRWYGPLTLLAVCAALVHLVTVEYFAGVELLRPALLYLLAREEPGSWGRRLAVTLRRWAPYLLALGGFFLWRILWMPTPGYDHNTPVLLFDLLARPLSAALELARFALQDFVTIVPASWYKTFQADLFELRTPAGLARLFLTVAGAAGLTFYLARLEREGVPRGSDPPAGDRPAWSREALAIGALGTLLGPVPAWITGQSISTQNPLWSDRLGLAAMFGASLLIAGLLEELVQRTGARRLILGALVGLALGWHFQSANEFRWAWEDQRDFYRQLVWRAPAIAPGTAILSNDELFRFMGDYPTGFALNTLYPQPGPASQAAYWFFTLNPGLRDQLESLRAGTTLRFKKFSTQFSGDSRDAFVVFYEAEADHCLWVLGPEHAALRGLPELTRQALAVSNLERIQASPPEEGTFAAVVLGQDSAPGWCFYYQKAELARQRRDWGEAVRQWQAASQRGLAPNHGFEYLPFIEAFARRGEWEQALQLTRRAGRQTATLTPALCAAWERIAVSSAPGPGRDEALNEAGALLACQEP
jgi:hypothetical protein